MSINHQTSEKKEDAVEQRRKSRVGIQAIIRGVFKHKLSRVGFIIIILLLCMALFAPVLAPYDPNAQDLYNVLKGPSAEHWLGTDNVGRDLLSRVIYGSRVSMMVGFFAVFISAIIGSFLGLLAGYRGGVVDMVIMRIVDTFMCIPYLPFVLVLAAALGPGLKNIIIALAVLGWTGFCRIMRGQVLMVRELPYIEAARAVGASHFRIMLKHLFPNCLAPIIVAATISLGAFIMLESTMAFFGLGAEPPTPSWGKELRTGYSYLEMVPFFSIAPGLLITLAILAFNFLGDGLRDSLDPRLRGEGKKIQ
jgi:ABC-type dipeptide/oligopeptide/nickel transport system permease subunit